MRYVCQICGYIYDEAKENVPFDELPDTWKCPICHAPKTQFKPEAVKAASAAEPAPDVLKEDSLTQLSAGQLASLCSNLARGCEKQYREEEAAQFRLLADYFTSVTPQVEDPTVEMLAELLQKDIDNYPSVRSVADDSSDRGTARVCVWGEKVTRMLSSLVNRYIEEGEKMLEDTDIWICTICGFVYTGDTPPALCPVCKVPAWKFEKVEGRVSA